MSKRTFCFHLGMAANADIGLRRSDVRKCQGESHRSGTIEDVRVSGRLDGLHILHNRHRSDTSDKFDS